MTLMGLLISFQKHHEFFKSLIDPNLFKECQCDVFELIHKIKIHIPDNIPDFTITDTKFGPVALPLTMSGAPEPPSKDGDKPRKKNVLPVKKDRPNDLNSKTAKTIDNSEDKKSPPAVIQQTAEPPASKIEPNSTVEIPASTISSADETNKISELEEYNTLLSDKPNPPYLFDDALGLKYLNAVTINQDEFIDLMQQSNIGYDNNKRNFIKVKNTHCLLKALKQDKNIILDKPTNTIYKKLLNKLNSQWTDRLNKLKTILNIT